MIGGDCVVRGGWCARRKLLKDSENVRDDTIFSIMTIVRVCRVLTETIFFFLLSFTPVVLSVPTAVNCTKERLGN